MADPPHGPPTRPPRLVPDAPELRPRLGNRDLFGGLDPLVYANHAGISPPSVVVRRAVDTLLRDYGKRGAAAYPTWAAQRDRLREKLAKLIGAEEPADIGLSQNTSRGISDVALCFPWQRGDRVVVFRGEFPANVTPWLRAAETFGLEVVWLDGAEYRRDEPRALQALGAEIERGVRLVAVSAVQFQTGHRMPLAKLSALCKPSGTKLFVDAVQACGIVHIDVVAEGIDYLACGAHKWLMGLEGAGFVYARRDAAALLTPRVASWLSHESPVDFLFEGAGRLDYEKPIVSRIGFVEGGNLSAMSFAALEASLDLILEIGQATIFEHVSAWNDALERGAVELGFRSVRSVDPAYRSGTLSLECPDGRDVVDVHRELTRLGIACALPDGLLRFSPHWPNAVDETEQVLLSLEQAVAARRPG